MLVQYFYRLNGTLISSSCTTSYLGESTVLLILSLMITWKHTVDCYRMMSRWRNEGAIIIGSQSTVQELGRSVRMTGEHCMCSTRVCYSAYLVQVVHCTTAYSTRHSVYPVSVYCVWYSHVSSHTLYEYAPACHLFLRRISSINWEWRALFERTTGTVDYVHRGLLRNDWSKRDQDFAYRLEGLMFCFKY